MFVGKPDPWLDADGNVDDTAVIAANGSVYQHESTIYQDMTFGKLIGNTNVSYLIPRYDWTNNTVFDAYSQFDGDLYSKRFYVVNDKFQVYKCIDNNNGANSTVKPSLTSESGTFYTSDGYTWKYMYTIQSSSNTNFTSNTFIPVTINANVAANAVNGTIDVVRVNNSGTNYRTYYSGYIVNSVNNYTVTVDSGASSYSGFYVDSSMYLKSGFGSGQIRKIKLYDGLNKLVTLYEPFTTYGIFNVKNVTGSISVGNILTQNIDSINTLYKQGIFQVGDVVRQSDTGANGTIIAANSTILRVIRGSGATTFNTTYPIVNMNNSGTLKSGSVTVKPFTQLTITSNTGAFTVGEWIYQNNGAANTANGLIFSANSSTIMVGLVSGSFVNTYQVKGNTSTSNAVVSTVGSNNTGNSYIYSVPGSGTTFTTDFNLTSNYYIRIGSNPNTAVARITSVNSTVIGVSQPFTSTYVANAYYSIPDATVASGITLISANGVVTNTNLNGIKLLYSNAASLAYKFIVGERVDQVNSSDVYQGANAIVSFSNSSTLILSDVNGTFTGGGTLYVRGESSLQKANIDTISSYPTITVSSPIGTFYEGQNIIARSASTFASLGSANVVSFYTIPNQLTEYVISPTVVIDGDGDSTAKAYSVVNATPGSGNSISDVIVIDPGIGYSEANVYIVANTSYGSNSVLEPVISPALGHGSNTVAELGARYAGISISFDVGAIETYKFPLYGKYRRIGIIKNPLYSDVTVNMDSFSRAKLVVSNTSGTGFTVGEYVYQPNTGAIGLISYKSAYNIQLSNVTGTFSANGKYANGSTSNDYIVGLSSNTTSNVSTSNVIYFSLASNVEVVSESTGGAHARIVAINSNTQMDLTNVDGSFQANDTVYDPVTNAYANVTSIYTSNGTVDVSTVFGQRFNQSLRFPMSSNTAAFTQFEYVRQLNSNAIGRVISNANEFDLTITGANGSFTAGDVITNQTTAAKAILLTANSSYLRATSANGSFAPGQVIINNLNVGATIGNSYPVLVLDDVAGTGNFQSGATSANVVGQTSGAIGRFTLLGQVIVYPDLVRNSGTVMYLENIEPFTISNTSKENIRLVIKF
jgi:hypothetical protein